MLVEDFSFLLLTYSALPLFKSVDEILRDDGTTDRPEILLEREKVFSFSNAK